MKHSNCPDAVIERFNPARSQVHLDAILQLRQRPVLEIIIDQEGDLARRLVELDDVSLVHVTVKHSRAADINAQQRWKFIQQASMKIKRLFVLPTQAQTLAGNLNLTGVSRGKEQFPAQVKRSGVVPEKRF